MYFFPLVEPVSFDDHVDEDDVAAPRRNLQTRFTLLGGSSYIQHTP